MNVNMNINRGTDISINRGIDISINRGIDFSVNSIDISINIDGKEVKARPGQTIYEAAKESGISSIDIPTAKECGISGIDIPTLCHDDRLESYGSCGICVVEVEDNPKLLRACSTLVADGMIISTNTDRVKKSRIAVLELMLSDHIGDCRPPCTLACPAQTDCQGYVGLIANGQIDEAARLIKDVIPLPASIGRICPHPCESACRREMVEDPINIAQLKAVAGDYSLVSGEAFGGYMWKKAEDTGKTVAVIGGGPGGLTAAYQLRRQGHQVAILDAMPKMGGMLRYGIPEYRLPKALLDQEISLLERMGISMVNNTRIGEDVRFDYLRAQYNAVVVAIGAWKSTGMSCPGDDLPGVIGGIEFLKDVALNKPVNIGKKVAVVGGGNTAMDACRTALRLGAEEVYIIYRRTRAEMPAEEIEITEAEEEGVIFKYLTNPLEITAGNEENARNKKVSSVSLQSNLQSNLQLRLQLMELGEPDASGRRSPVAIKGAEETLSIDTIIMAIGQSVDGCGFDALDTTRWKTIIADESTFATNIEGVFAVGDATNNGPSIAIEAIAEAQKAAIAIDEYLRSGNMLNKKSIKTPYYATSEKTTPNFKERFKEKYKEIEKVKREHITHADPAERRKNFELVTTGYTLAQAQKEASRCLECGCADYFECKLLKYANEYDINPEKYQVDSRDQEHPRDQVDSRDQEHPRDQVDSRDQEHPGNPVGKEPIPPDDSNPYYHRNMEKCILCGMCVRVCEEVIGLGVLGFHGRGYNAIARPAEKAIADSDCCSCGTCVSLCPTGALTEKLPGIKNVPLKEHTTPSTCALCSVGCSVILTTSVLSSNQTKNSPLNNHSSNSNHSNHSSNSSRLLRSLPAENSVLCSRGRFQLVSHTNQLTTPLIRRGDQLVPCTYEEAYLHIAKKLQMICSTNQANQANQTIQTTQTNPIGISVSGKLTNEEITQIKDFAAPITQNIFSLNEPKNALAEITGRDASTCTFDEMLYTNVILMACPNIFESHPIAGLKVQQAVKNGALLLQYDGNPPKEYLNAKNAVIIFDQKTTSTNDAKKLANIAKKAGHLEKPHSGIIQLKPHSNSQGLSNAGIERINTGLFKTLRGLIIFGEDASSLDTSTLELLVVSDTTLTETAKKADVVLPASDFSQSAGTYTNTVGEVLTVNAATSPPTGKNNSVIIKELMEYIGRD